MFIPIGAIFLLLVAASITFAVIHINGIDKAYLQGFRSGAEWSHKLETGRRNDDPPDDDEDEEEEDECELS